MLSRRCQAVIAIVVLCGFISGCEADDPDLTDDNTPVAVELKNSQQSNVRSDESAQAQHGGLIVGLVAPQQQVEPGVDLELVFSVENLTDDAAVILPWGTPMEVVLSADVFDVDYEGESLPYQGRLIKRAAPTATDYLTVQAGEKKDFSVNLSQAYDTRSAGLYTVQLKSSEGLYRFDNHNAQIATAALLIERL